MSPTPGQSFGSVRSNLKKTIKWIEKLDTVRKDNKTVSHTFIRLKNVCFVGKAAGKSTSYILLLFM